ncbi:unnamed protein product [Brachionus calyciflorus]|uniref:Uncharacterized protein n=1 Tax=Brachionus calyciflorus TaxID=104777 RepID=A0A813Q7V0_9BILA|nr:unnamed protein product [Brachionus calyciflorus]
MQLTDFLFQYFDNKIPFFRDKVDFTRVANENKKKDPLKSPCLKLLIDADSAMDRLTGGRYPDWQSGGQWGHVSNFYTELKRVCKNNSIEIVIFFNGTLPNLKSNKWYQKQLEIRKRANSIFNSNGMPEQKNWIEPVYSTQSIIFELNSGYYTNGDNIQNNVFCYSTYTDHNKDIVNYLIKNKCDCLLTDNLELIGLVMLNRRFEKNENLKNLSLLSAKSVKLSTLLELTAYTYNFEDYLNMPNMNYEAFGWLMIIVSLSSLNFEALKSFFKRILPFKKIEDTEYKNYKIEVVDKLIKFIESNGSSMTIDVLITEEILNSTDEDQIKHRQTIIDYVNYMFTEDFDTNPLWARSKHELLSNKLFTKVFKSSNDADTSNISTDSEKDLEVSIYDEQYELTLKQLHVNCIKPSNIINLILKKQFFLPVILEPTTSSELRKADDIYKSIRERCYSALFSGESETLVEEYYLDYEMNILKKQKVNVTPLDKTKKIDHIMNMKRNDRKIQFCKTIGESFSFMSPQIFTTNLNLLIPCLVIRYLIKQEMLTENDIISFLATFDKYVFRNKREFEGKRDLRATYLATMFLKGIEYFSFVNEVFGNPLQFKSFYLKNYFDGNVFQKYYYQAYNNECSLEEKISCNNVKIMLKFVKMDIRNLILPSTPKFPAREIDPVSQENNKPIIEDDEIDLKPNRIYLGRGLLTKNMAKSRETPKPNGNSLFGKSKSTKNTEKNNPRQFEDSANATSSRNLIRSNRHSSPISDLNQEKCNLDEDYDWEETKLVRFPLEHVKLQDEVMELISLLNSKKLQTTQTRSLRYTFSREAIENYEKSHNFKPKQEKSVEKKYPKMIKLSDFPILMQMDSLIKRKQNLLEQISKLDSQSEQASRSS